MVINVCNHGEHYETPRILDLFRITKFHIWLFQVYQMELVSVKDRDLPQHVLADKTNSNMCKLDEVNTNSQSDNTLLGLP
jgi:hypothetical protein